MQVRQVQLRAAGRGTVHRAGANFTFLDPPLAKASMVFAYGGAQAILQTLYLGVEGADLRLDLSLSLLAYPSARDVLVVFNQQSFAST